MTAPTPTAALTPEELAAKIDPHPLTPSDGAMYIRAGLARDAASVLRAQKLHTDRVDGKLVEQERQIERLTKERDELRSRDLSWSKTFQRIEVEANEDVRKLATSLERERVMREALERLENANDALCATRSDKTYASMLDDGATDALNALDVARREARAALQPQEVADVR